METLILPPGFPLKGGNYKITKLLGQGGFGITYEAEQVLLGRKVAVKEFFMKDSCNRDSTSSAVSIPATGSYELVEKFRDKFIREARLIASMNNPHIVRIYDVFEENDTAYYVMEALDGGSLTDLVKREGALPEPRAIEYIRQLGEALGYIHKRNILHLDVKPSNVLLGPEGEAVLIDFGISKRYDEGGNQTSSTPVGISEGFAPGEQYRAGDISTFKPATDIYSLGATLYYLVTATVPPSATEVLNEGLARPEGISDVTWAAIERAMAPRVKDRPQSAAEFLALLPAGEAPVAPAPSAPAPSAEGTVLPGEVFPPAQEVAAQQVPYYPQEVASQEAAPQKKKGKGVLVGIISGIVAAAIGAGVYIYLGQNKEGSTDTEDNTAVAQTETPSADKPESVPGRPSGASQGSAAPSAPSQPAESSSSEAPASSSADNAIASGPEAGSEAGHDWVNLGLSVRWATCNLGATSLEQPGLYYAWGELLPKQNYSADTYKASPSLSNVSASEDAARAVWKGSWRLPTKKEVTELVNKCKWEWIKQNGRPGYKVTGPNGKSIFLPAAGLRDGSAAPGMGSAGVYATSAGASDAKASCVKFDERGKSVSSEERRMGFSIRPVCK